MTFNLIVNVSLQCAGVLGRLNEAYMQALDDRKHDAKWGGYDQSDEHTARFWLNDGAPIAASCQEEFDKCIGTSSGSWASLMMMTLLTFEGASSRLYALRLALCAGATKGYNTHLHMMEVSSQHTLTCVCVLPCTALYGGKSVILVPSCDE